MVGILRRIRARTLAVLRAVSAVTIGGVTASHRPIRARSNCWGVKCGRWSGSGLVLAGALAAGGLSGSALAVAPRESRAPISLIWDDDCGSDLDCVYSLEALHRQIDRKIVSVRALILDSPNPFGAPVLRAWNELWHHSLPIGAYRGSTGAKGADSGWSRAVRGALRPDDLSARYPDCVSVYRQALAGAPQHSAILTPDAPSSRDCRRSAARNARIRRVETRNAASTSSVDPGARSVSGRRRAAVASRAIAR